MISGRKYQGLSGFRLFTRRVKSVKQAKFRLPDIQPVYLKKPLNSGISRVGGAIAEPTTVLNCDEPVKSQIFENRC
jgi:hypothetical protein